MTYAELDAEASLIPIGSEGLLAIETFQGSRTPSTYLHVPKDFSNVSVFYFIVFCFILFYYYLIISGVLANIYSVRHISRFFLFLELLYTAVFLPFLIVINLLYFILLYSSTFYSILFYSTLLYSTLLYSTTLYCVWSPILFYSTLLYFNLLYSILFCPIPLHSILYSN